MKKILLSALAAFAVALSFGTATMATETTGEKVKTELNKTGSKINKAGRTAGEKICDATKGKDDPACIERKIKNKVKNAGDTVKDTATEVKDKVD